MAITGNINTTGTIAVGSPVVGTLASYTQQDWYAVNLTAGTSYTVSLTPQSSNSQSVPHGPQIGVDTSGGTDVSNADLSGISGQPQSETLTVPVSGQYFLAAEAYPVGANVLVQYTLSITGPTNDTDDGVNTTLTMIYDDGAYFGEAGKTTDASDHAWVRVFLNAGQTYKFNVDTAAGSVLTDPEFTVVDANRVVQSVSSGGTPQHPWAMFTAQNSANYYVVVDSAGSTGFGGFTASTTDNRIDDSITKLYIGYYDRAPDPAGETYYVRSLQDLGTPLTNIAQSHALDAEAKGIYPFLASGDTSNTASVKTFVDAIYTNLFNRAPDTAGEAYWIGQLQSGASSVGGAILNIINGAQNNDETTVNNKVSVADYYDTQVFNNNKQSTVVSAHAVLSGVTFIALSVAEGGDSVRAYVATAPLVASTSSQTEVSLVGISTATDPTHIV